MIWSWPSGLAAWRTSRRCIPLIRTHHWATHPCTAFFFFLFYSYTAWKEFIVLSDCSHQNGLIYSLPNNTQPGSICSRSSAADSMKVQRCWRYNTSWKCHTALVMLLHRWRVEEVSSGWVAHVSPLRSKLSYYHKWFMCAQAASSNPVKLVLHAEFLVCLRPLSCPDGSQVHGQL